MRMMQSLREHWPEYLFEAAGLGIFMLSAGVFATLLESPHSLVHQAIADDLTRRGLMGVAMGLTTVGLIYSPWGQRSSASATWLPVTSLVSGLYAGGLVETCAVTKKGTGMTKRDVVLGIDIGGTTTSFGFVSRQGDLLSETTIPTRSGERSCCCKRACRRG